MKKSNCSNKDNNIPENNTNSCKNKKDDTNDEFGNGVMKNFGIILENKSNESKVHKIIKDSFTIITSLSTVIISIVALRISYTSSNIANTISKESSCRVAIQSENGNREKLFEKLDDYVASIGAMYQQDFDYKNNRGNELSEDEKKKLIYIYNDLSFIDDSEFGKALKSRMESILREILPNLIVGNSQGENLSQNKKEDSASKTNEIDTSNTPTPDTGSSNLDKLMTAYKTFRNNFDNYQLAECIKHFAEN